jgi:hypothetical protein
MSFSQLYWQAREYLNGMRFLNKSVLFSQLYWQAREYLNGMRFLNKSVLFSQLYWQACEYLNGMRFLNKSVLYLFAEPCMTYAWIFSRLSCINIVLT